MVLNDDTRQIVHFINQLSLEKRSKRISNASEIAICAAWEDIGYEQALNLYSTENPPALGYVSSIAGRDIWKFLSNEFDIKITKKNFRCQLMELEKKGVITVDLSPPSEKEVIPDSVQQNKGSAQKQYFGYQKELELGIDAIHNRWSLITTGAPGVGKSTFVSQLTRKLSDNENPFDKIFWKSFHYLPSISELISEWCQSLNIADVSATSLIQYFSSHRCLIVLDQAEQLLGPDSIQIYEDYIVFLRRFIEEQSLSSFVVTSVKPLNELIDFQGYGHSIQLITLKGLNNKAARDLLDSYNLNDQDRWDFVIEKYRGNPQALIKIATLCHDFFGGSVELYLEKQSTLIGASFINSLNSLLSVDDPLVDLQIKILRYFYDSCHTDDGISVNTIIEEVTSLGYSDSTSNILEALNALVHQSFVEKFDTEKVAHFRLPPMIRKYVQVNPNGLFAAA